MNESPKLTRWTSGSSEAPPELRQLLQASRAELGSADEVAELSRNLARALGPAAGLPAARVAASKASLGLGHWAAWLAGGAGGALVLWNLLGLQPVKEAVEEPPASIASAVPEAAPLERAQPTPALEAAPAVGGTRAPLAEAAPLGSDRKVTAHHAVAARGPGAKPRATRPSESELLRRAQAALAEQPAEALSLTRQHASRFPHGALAQEREVIAIEALERLGRKSAAADRALEFEKRYRGSVHQSRLRGGTPAAAPPAAVPPAAMPPAAAPTPPDSTRVPH